MSKNSPFNYSPTTSGGSGSDSYKGAWNASSNTPTLADGTGTNGDFYRVSVSGSQNLGSGSISFYAGNLVIYNGSIWQQVGASTAASTAARQTPSGLVNGSNVTFTVSNTPIANTLAVYLNGLFQNLVSDYTFSGVTITFITAPSSGETILTTYYY
jgi:hypothetical protein